MFISNTRVVCVLANLQLCSFRACRVTKRAANTPYRSKSTKAFIVIWWLIKYLVRSLIGMQTSTHGPGHITANL